MRSVILAGTLCLSACVSVPSYDESLDSLLSDTQKEASAFYAKIALNTDSEKCRYSKNLDFWSSNEASLRRASVRARALPQNALYVAPIQRLQVAFNAFRESHELAERQAVETAQQRRRRPPRSAARLTPSDFCLAPDDVRHKADQADEAMAAVLGVELQKKYGGAK